MCILTAVFIGLIAAFTYLAVNLRRYFADQLSDEAFRIQAIFSIFTVTFFTKAVFIVLEGFEVFENDFLVETILNIFDIIPLSLIIGFHWFCFSAQC